MKLLTILLAALLLSSCAASKPLPWFVTQGFNLTECGPAAARNDGDCLELASRNVTLKICNEGFDVEYNGQSLIDSISDAFASCCNGNRPLDGWKP